MTCHSTNVEPRPQIVTQDGFTHAGLLTHKCKLEEGHEGMCECACGRRRYIKNYK